MITMITKRMITKRLFFKSVVPYKFPKHIEKLTKISNCIYQDAKGKSAEIS